MEADRVGEYFLGRRRGSLERTARGQEWDNLARYQTTDDICARLGLGWWELACELHYQLLSLDRDYRLLGVAEQQGGLDYRAQAAIDVWWECDRLLLLGQGAALSTCVVCADKARLRSRPRLRTLCDACFASDRATASERGERYAEIVLRYLMSGDPDYPTPEEVVAWMEALRKRCQ